MSPLLIVAPLLAALFFVLVRVMRRLGLVPAVLRRFLQGWPLLGLCLGVMVGAFVLLPWWTTYCAMGAPAAEASERLAMLRVPADAGPVDYYSNFFLHREYLSYDTSLAAFGEFCRAHDLDVAHYEWCDILAACEGGQARFEFVEIASEDHVYESKSGDFMAIYLTEQGRAVFWYTGF